MDESGNSDNMQTSAGISAHHPPQVDGCAEAAGDDVRVSQPRTDAETLREIARRIREGQAERAAARASVQPATPPTEPPSALELPNGLAMSKLAHELRTPLSAIVAAAEIMRDERFGPIGSQQYRGYSADIHDSARHALAVINSMIGHPEPGGNTKPQQFVEIDINALVERTVSVMLPLAEQARLALPIALYPRLPHVIADATSIRQILLNVLTNAVKFTAPEGEVQISTHYVLDGPVRIEVCDTGAGMSEAAIRSSLDPLHPPEPGPRAEGGLGLGLPLVRELAAANGAEISIESAEGKGTSVTLLFPKNRVIPV